MELIAPVEHVCWRCKHYGFLEGNPKGWGWALCMLKCFWFPDKELKPGDRKGCEEWVQS
jgi:hypothetical protein